jgi:adenine-specific DNA-methyltransferase
LFLLQYRKNKKNWHYTSVLVDEGKGEYVASTLDGDGNEIKIFIRKNAIIKSVNQLIKEEGTSEKEIYYKYSRLIKMSSLSNTESLTKLIFIKIYIP